MEKTDVIKWAEENKNTTQIEGPRDEIYAEAAWEIVSLHRSMTEWKEKYFEKDPVYAFDWAGQTMDDACKLDLYCLAVMTMFEAEKKGEAVADTLKRIHAQITDSLIKFYDFENSQQGGPRGLIMSKKGYASARFLEVLNNWLRKYEH